MRSIGLDLGSTNVKAVVVEIDPSRPEEVRRVALASRPTAADACTLVSDTLDLITDVVEQVGGPPDCVGVASMAESGVPLDSDDHPVGDLVRWDGRRGHSDAEALTRTFGADELFAATGVRPAGKTPLATWAYLRRAEPGRWAMLRRWAGAADLIVLALTGRLVTDHTLAGRTMAFRLPETGRLPGTAFDDDLLAAVGLRPDQLPEIAAPGQIAGEVTTSAAGPLPSGTPVVVAGHDHAVGAWAGGMRSPGDVADSVGTAEAVIRVVAQPLRPSAVLASGMSMARTVTGDQTAIVAGLASAGAMLSWWVDQVAGGHEDLAPFDEAAGRARPTGLFVLPYLNGRQTPEPDPTARPRLIGDASGRDLVDLAGALLDGLSLQVRWMITEQARLADVDRAAGEIVVLGSAARSGSAWLATKAAVGPARLRTVEEPEAVATGAAILAARRAGLIGPDAPVLRSRPVPVGPDPAYDSVFDDFVRIARERS